MLYKQRKREQVIRRTKNITHVFRRTLSVIVLLITPTTASFAQSDAEDAKWFIDVLEVEEGSVVAEIGAGDGSLTLAMARHVGPGGQVYSSELGADSVQYLQNVVNSAPVSNVTVIKGHPNRTNFPKECCSALFMRRVYHHFKNPAAMNKSIWQSLKPGGRLALIDFAPRGTEDGGADNGSLGPQHGVTLDTVVKELKDAGFSLISSDKRTGRTFSVVMEKKE